MKIKDFTFKPFLGLALSASVIALITACSSGSGVSGSGAVAGDSYTGPGSRWDVLLADDDTFNITMRETASDPVAMTITGDYETLVSGFLKLTVGTVTADSGVDAPSPNDVGYALNVPGYVFILKPLDATGDQVIPMVSGGECPTENVDANWVMVKVDNSADASDSNRDFFGTFHFDVSTETPSLPTKFALDQSPVTGGGLSSGTCAEGIMVVDDEGEMYLTTNGGAIVRTGIDTPGDESDDNFIFGFSQQAVGDISNVAGDYAGLLFDANQASGSQISPVSVTCAANGACTGNIVTDIENNTLSADSVTISLTTADNPSTGFITGTITDSKPGSIAGNMACMANSDAQGTGKNIVSCVGQSPGDATEMFNVLLVSK